MRGGHANGIRVAVHPGPWPEPLFERLSPPATRRSRQARARRGSAAGLGVPPMLRLAHQPCLGVNPAQRLDNALDRAGELERRPSEKAGELRTTPDGIFNQRFLHRES